MKKFLLILSSTLGALLLIGGIVYVALFMEEQQPVSVPVEESSSSQQSSPKINTYREADNEADTLELLDYATTQNQDTVGWIYIPGTKVNNSVLQAQDNNAYLRRNEANEEDIFGAYFVDYECAVGDREKLSPNTIVYGHSDLKDNPDGLRFSQLFKFLDPVFARNTPVIQFSTMEDYMGWEVFAVCYADVSFPYFYPSPEGGVEQLAAEAMEMSLYDYGVEVGPEDKILTLSTCTVKFGENDRNHRLLVMAKLLPEDAEVPNTVEVTVKS